MDSYRGYKLKPKDYQIQSGDIIIRVIGGTPSVPPTTIGIANDTDTVDTSKVQKCNTHFSNWRAIETKSISEAVNGDTVYCIENTGGACQKHDCLEINISISNKYVYPRPNQTLINGEKTRSTWSWYSKYFIVLVKTNKSVQEHPSTPVDPFEAKPGDYVEWIGETIYPALTKGSLYKVKNARLSHLTIINNRGNKHHLKKLNFKRINNDTINQTKANNKYEYLYDAIEGIIPKDAGASTTTYVDPYSPMYKPQQTQTNTKGKQMNSNLFTDILKLLTQVEQTDLEKAPSTYAFFYNNNGEYEGTARVANENEAKALLKKPEHLGYTMRIYKFSDEFTTQIPVVSTIKKVATEPKPPRKSRVAKA